jgi:hypothetical protein
MEPIQPFWFKQRQCKVEPAGENTLKVTGPNLPEAFLSVGSGPSGWRAAVRLTADGPEVRVAENVPGPKEAWDAAFELFREQVII